MPETIQPTPEQAAYQQLANGINAVLTLESTDAHTFNMLMELTQELWIYHCPADRTGQTRHWLAHVAEVQGKEEAADV